MRITIQPTERSVQLDECEVQVWNGVTAAGVSCVLLVRRVMPLDEGKYPEFVREMDKAGARKACGWK
jgi:hypothetical protein